MIDVVDSYGVEVVIETVMRFVTQTFDQSNLTIAPTGQLVPLSLCMYMNKNTLVYIYIYTYMYMQT